MGPKMSESHITTEEAIMLLKHTEKKTPSPKLEMDGYAYYLTPLGIVCRIVIQILFTQPWF